MSPVLSAPAQQVKGPTAVVSTLLHYALPLRTLLKYEVLHWNKVKMLACHFYKNGINKGRKD